MLSAAGQLLIGHNLDDYVPTPGLVFINKRGTSKHNISWDDLRFKKMKSHPRIQWVSRFASITCNAFGKEFPDGGLNEAGLYVGEMTLLGSIYPAAEKQPKFYHHQWIQYLLDNFETVEQVLADLGKVAIEGHCQWHFFVADAGGQAATIEFLKGNTVVHTDSNMPVKALCNAAYDKELIALQDHEGFGGNKPLDFSDKSGPLRFAQAASMLLQFQQQPPQAPTVEDAFRILQQLDCGNNKWQLVFDVPQRRLYYRTSLAQSIKSACLTSFDLSGNTPAMMLDINTGGEGDTSAGFRPFDETLNCRFIKQMWDGVNMGFALNTLFKPLLVKRLSDYPKTFATWQ